MPPYWSNATSQDICNNANNPGEIWETYCDGQYVKTIKFMCPNGCENSACRPATAPPLTPVSINVVSPNGGETLIKGRIYTITWTASGSSLSGLFDDDKLWVFLMDSNNTSQLFLGEFAKNVYSYSWTVPNTIKSGQYKIKVFIASCIHTRACNFNYSDISDNYFNIVAPTVGIDTIDNQIASIFDAQYKV